MKVLITGGCGFIGSHLVEHFLGSPSSSHSIEEVRILDNFRSGKRENAALFPAANLIEGSVTDREAVRAAVQGIDYVFHLAALISVAESMTNIMECIRINTEGTVILLEECERAGVKKLVFSSSAALYGDDPSFPKTEDMRVLAKSPYAQTKYDGEYYCNLFTQMGRLQTTCLRYFNVCGPRQDPNSQYAAAVPRFVTAAVANEPITVFGDGEQTRDFVYVKDVVSANVWAATHADVTGVYNVGYGKRITINALLKRILELTSSSSVIKYAPERPGDVKHSMACVDKLASTGWRPSFSFDQALEATVQYFQPKP